MLQNNEKEFTGWRSLLWPIYAYELKKVLPMLLLFFCITFNFIVLRDTKDALILTAPGSTVLAIHFIKIWFLLPIAAIFVLIYAKLSNVLSRQALFYITIVPFILFFAFFALVLYPGRGVLHPTDLADRLELILPDVFSGFVPIFRNWTFALFYIFSELWGSVMLSLVFWGFANEITHVKEAKRFYALFGVSASIALLLSGPFVIWASKIREGVDAWGMSINYLMAMVTTLGLITILAYWWINKYVLSDKKFYNTDEIKALATSTPKMSLKESFSFLIRSKYLACIALLVIAYGVSVNIIDSVWKAQVQLQYRSGNEFNAFMGHMTFWTGVASLLITLFFGSYVIRRFGWKCAALITPILLFIFGACFFSAVLFALPLVMMTLLGAFPHVMGRAFKHAFFDPTKEMTYIPLDQESKVKGKALIDVMGARFAQSGSSFTYQVLFVALGSSVSAIVPYLGVILLIMIAVWIVAVFSLNKEFLSVNRVVKRSFKLKNKPFVKWIACVVIICAGLFGLSFVEELTYEYPLRFEGVYSEYGDKRLDLVAKFIPNNPVIFEAGGHYGYDTVEMSHKWPRARVLSFEPNPYAFKKFLKTTQGISNIEGYPLAVGMHNGTATLNICEFDATEDPAYGMSGSLLESSDWMEEGYKGPHVSVPCVVLDDWSHENNVSHIDFMWLDLEGYELQFLQSSPEILNTVKVIYAETNFKEFRKGMTQYSQLKDFLEKSGFRLLSHWYSRGLQGDAIFIKNELYPTKLY